jgi:hypothetical protein
MGCDAVRFRIIESNSDDGDWDEDSQTYGRAIYERDLFPDDAQGRRQPEDSSRLPHDVAKMYLETIKCFNRHYQGLWRTISQDNAAREGGPSAK